MEKVIKTDSNDASVITMTTESPKMKIFMAGTGTCNIDRGDGSEIETVNLCEFEEDFNDADKRGKFGFCLNSDIASRTVTISGENITHLICSGNRLTGLDVTQNPALVGLACGVNRLSTLNVGSNTAMNWLNCADNRLSTLDVSQNTALSGLNCAKNQLTDLDVSRNTELKQLDCSKNQLSTIDVAKNTALIQLCCSDNQLTTLDVTKNTELMEFQCYDNQLASLDFTKNTKLIELQCDDNQLLSLDLSQNTMLMNLECQNNQLSSLDLSACTMLRHLKCHSNRFQKLEDFVPGIINTRRIQIKEIASNKYAIGFPMYKVEGGMYEIYLIADAGKFYLSDEGTTYAELDKIFEMQEHDVIKNLVAIMKQYGVRKHQVSNAFTIECNPRDIHIKLSYLIQALTFMINMKIFYI